MKSFRAEKTSHMHWHAKPAIEKKPENIIIPCGTNDISKKTDPEKITADIINLTKSVSEESGSNVIISGLVPRKVLRDYCGNCVLTFLKHGNINAKTHCNVSGLH